MSTLLDNIGIECIQHSLQLKTCLKTYLKKTPQTNKKKNKTPHLNQKAFLTASIHGGHILPLILYLVLIPIHFGLANLVINNYVFHNSLLCLHLFLSQTEQKFEYREYIS